MLDKISGHSTSELPLTICVIAFSGNLQFVLKQQDVSLIKWSLTGAPLIHNCGILSSRLLLERYRQIQSNSPIGISNAIVSTKSRIICGL